MPRTGFEPVTSDFKSGIVTIRLTRLLNCDSLESHTYNDVHLAHLKECNFD